MAVAWTLSIASSNIEDVLPFETWIYKKAIQKIIESKQITPEIKETVRSWKCN